MNKFDKYYNYQLTFPFIGNKIYKSKSRTKAIDKCYNEYIKSEYNNNKIFGVTDLDSKIEYRFEMKDKIT